MAMRPAWPLMASCSMDTVIDPSPSVLETMLASWPMFVPAPAMAVAALMTKAFPSPLIAPSSARVWMARADWTTELFAMNCVELPSPS